MNFDLANQEAVPHENAIIFANFNQDYSSIVVGSRNGYQVYHLPSIDKLDLIFNKHEPREVKLVDRLFSSSLVSLVSSSSPRRLDVCHFKKGTEICNYSYPNTILAVKMNRMRLIVILEESIYIHNIRDMKVLHTIRDTPCNPKGICCLSTNNDRTIMAYPGNSISGEVQIFDVNALKPLNTISAHNSFLARMVFNDLANKIATASGKGTVIRVFSVSDGQKLFEFRRGVTRCVTIASLCFSPDSLFLCASSNTETVHIFKLERDPAQKNISPKESSSWLGYFNQAISSSASYLPTQVTEVFYQDRAFATVKLPFSGVKNISAIVILQKLPRALVIGGDGHLYVYNLDPEDGGECTLLHKHSLNSVGHPHEASSDELGSSCGFQERDSQFL